MEFNDILLLFTHIILHDLGICKLDRCHISAYTEHNLPCSLKDAFAIASRRLSKNVFIWNLKK